MLKGNNTISLSNSTALYQARAVYAEKNLTVKGDGKLTINLAMGNTNLSTIYGIATETGKLVIEGSAQITVNISSTYSGPIVHGLHGMGGVEVKDAAGFITSISTSDAKKQIGVFCGHGEVIFSGTGNKVIALDETSANTDISYGIYNDCFYKSTPNNGDVTISGSGTTSISGTAAFTGITSAANGVNITSQRENADGVFKLENTKLDINMGYYSILNTSDKRDIDAPDIIINNSTVDIANTVWGIGSCFNGIEIVNSTVDMSADNSCILTDKNYDKDNQSKYGLRISGASVVDLASTGTGYTLTTRNQDTYSKFDLASGGRVTLVAQKGAGCGVSRFDFMPQFGTKTVTIIGTYDPADGLPMKATDSSYESKFEAVYGDPITVNRIYLSHSTHREKYVVGETFDSTGLKICAEKSNGTSILLDVTADMVSGFDSTSVVAPQTLTITYRGQTTTFDVSIMSGPEFASNYRVRNLADGTVATDIEITMYGAEFVTVPAVGQDVSSWFTNLPDGLSARVKNWINGTGRLEVSISGTPTQASTDEIGVTIPGSLIKSGVSYTVAMHRTAGASKYVVQPPYEANLGTLALVGEKDTALTGGNQIDIHLSGSVSDTFTGLAVDDDITSWFTNIPAGLSVNVESLSADRTSLTAGFDGTPTAVVAGLIQVTIPAAKMTNNTVDMVVPTNAAASYSITPAHVHTLVLHAKKEPTTTAYGKEAYYECTAGCGKYYTDAAGTNEILDIGAYGVIPKLSAPPTPVPTPTPTPAPAPEVERRTEVVDIYHVVAPGDYLNKIARRYNLTLAAILERNPAIKNPHWIYVGQKIKVGTKVVETTITAPAAPTTPAQTKIYSVVRGDNLIRIARKHGMTLARLYELNPGMLKRKYIYAGDKIVVD